MKKAFFSILFAFFILFADHVFCETQGISQSKDKVLQYAKPKKPVKIKLHRDKKGEYSWDITGESVEEVIRTDKRLRQLLKEE